MTGCPNACARPYNSDIGIVGRTLGKYTIFLGGRLLGDRLNEQYKDVVPFEDLSKEITGRAHLLQGRTEGRRDAWRLLPPQGRRWGPHLG